MSDYFDKFVCGEDGLGELAKRIATTLKNETPYTVWLQARMGAGKTALVRHILWELGHDKNIPVVSPTYTIMNEYQIKRDWYAHVDFYRADHRFSLDELGLTDVREFAGVFIEWPQVPPEDMTLLPTHVIEIEHLSDNTRGYTFKKV